MWKTFETLNSHWVKCISRIRSKNPAPSFLLGTDITRLQRQALSFMLTCWPQDSCLLSHLVSIGGIKNPLSPAWSMVGGLGSFPGSRRGEVQPPQTEWSQESRSATTRASALTTRLQDTGWMSYSPPSLVRATSVRCTGRCLSSDWAGCCQDRNAEGSSVKKKQESCVLSSAE